MTDRPINLYAHEVRAFLDGRKTQLRRVVKPQPVPFGKSAYGGSRQGWKWKPESLNRSWNDDDADPYNFNPSGIATSAMALLCPFGAPRDTLWGRETWQDTSLDDVTRSLSYRATWRDEEPPEQGWRPSTTMPRWAARILLTLESVRVERLHDITEEDAMAEGMHGFTGLDVFGYDPHGTPGPMLGTTAVGAFKMLWEADHGARSWDANPFVWAATVGRNSE